jgi:hypothetical protein
MNNKTLGLLGYLILIFSINLEIFDNSKHPTQNFIQIIGYSFILYDLYHSKNNHKKEKEPEDKIQIGHLILFVTYFYSLFLSGENMYFVTLLTLIAHFILIKKNNKIIKLGYILSFIYYLMKSQYYISKTNYISKIKLVAFSLLALYNGNKSVLNH